MIAITSFMNAPFTRACSRLAGYTDSSGVPDSRGNRQGTGNTGEFWEKPDFGWECRSAVKAKMNKKKAEFDKMHKIRAVPVAGASRAKWR
jgi:hypothetical protein